nr:phospholipase-like protein [Tanacetum cinerariifolium]
MSKLNYFWLISQKLDANRRNLFRTTCFGCWLDLLFFDHALIYYTEGHSLHFDRPEFALITGFPFGTVNFGLYTFGELNFRNRVFSHKLGLSVTNLDVIGVIEDEETFRKLCDQDSIRLCLILDLEVIFMGRLLTCPVDDTLFRLVENLEDWNFFSWGEHICTHLYDEIKNVIEKHSDEHYFEMKKDRISYCCYLFAKESTKTTDIRPTIAEYDSSWWIRSHVFLVLARERNEEYGVLQFNEEFFSLGRDFMDSLNILFQDLIQPHYSDEAISNWFGYEAPLRPTPLSEYPTQDFTIGEEDERELFEIGEVGVILFGGEGGEGGRP